MPLPKLDLQAAIQRRDELLTKAEEALQAEDQETKAQAKGFMDEADVLGKEIVDLKRLDEMKAQTLEAAQKATAPADNGRPQDELDYVPEGSNFKHFNRFMKAVYDADRWHEVDDNLVHFEDDPVGGKTRKMTPTNGNRKVMVEGVGASGGFLVPPEQQMTTLSVSAPDAIVRPRATVIRMNRRQINIPVIDQTVGATGIAPWFGGLQVYFTEEGGLKEVSDMGFKEITLVAHKMTLRTLVSTELLDDSMISVSDLLMGPRGFGGAIPWTEEYTFMRGTGAGQARGVIGAGATIVVNRAVQGSITLPDILNMYQNFLPSGNGVWIAAQNTISTLMQMNGPAGNPSYVFMPSVRDGMPNYLLGMPLFFSDKSPRMAAGAVGDIMLCDWSYYLIGDRQATTMASSAHEYFSYNQVVFRAEHRYDGQPWLSAPITYEDGTTQVSPFVVLGGKST